MAAEAEVKRLVLVHFRPGEVDEAQTRRRMGEIYEGKIEFAEDMQSFSAR